MRVTLDLSPWVHHHAGLGRYAGELLSALGKTAPQNEYTALYHAARPIPLGAKLRGLETARVPLGAKPWRMSILLAYYTGLNFDRWLPPTDIFHGTDHLLPPYKSARSVFTIHDLIFRFFPEYHLPLNRWYLSVMLPKFLQRADAIIAVSEHTRRDVTRLMGIPAERLTVVHEGVASEFRPQNDPVERERVRAAYQLPPRFILFFSTIEPRKNLVTLLEAYSQLLKENTDTPPLVIAGRKGWLFESSLRRIDELGLTSHVRLTDWVREQDAAALLSLADVFVYPSLYEGFGLPPLEAMATGTPVIASNAGSLPEVLGDAAIMLDPRDVSGFANALRRVLANDTLRAELKARGLAQASQFTWERAARETLAVYARVLVK